MTINSNFKPTVIMASRNQGKLRELQDLLAPLTVDLLDLDDFSIGGIEENGASFFENALIKASFVCQQTGLPSLADDSGLMVEALGGAPGIYSARYSGDSATCENNSKLLKELAGVPDHERRAAFHCCMLLYCPDGSYVHAEGAWPGYILRDPIGENGFGYDPLFFDPELNMSAAQMPAELKNQRSHRARAAKKLIALWPDPWRKK